jgi:hypothetical protein
LFEGYGEYYFAEQEKTYFGNFEKGQMEGQGKEVWTDGRQYIGNYHNNMKHGQGTLIAEGKVYVGSWEKNMKHGIGYESKIEGQTRRKGEWKKGNWFRWLGQTETVSGSIKTTGNFI